MVKRAYEKMGIKSSDVIILLDAPDDAAQEIIFPELKVQKKLSGRFDHIVLFVKTQNEMKETFESLKPYLTTTGKLWVSWPKAGKLASDLNIPSVIKIGYDAGLVESMNLSINETWTTLKFTWPKPGKIYNNSYGTLPNSK
jgi:hypothetical protein